VNNSKRINNVTILGYGISGRAAEKLCHNQNINCTIIENDHDPLPDNFSDSEMFIVSPGLPQSSSLYQAAITTNIEMVSELEFAASYTPCRILAITGTNGKTTTTELTVHLLNACGIDARPSGNIGTALSEAVITATPETVLVVEVSSFQLELCHKFAPHAAALLNIASDHLERYDGSINKYLKTKLKIFDNISLPERRIIGTSLIDNPLLSDALKASCAKPLSPIIDPAVTSLSAPHNIENLSVALSLIKTIVPEEKMYSTEFIAAIKSFIPGTHRMEDFLTKNGIRYVDDSKATNPAAVIAAVTTLYKKGKIRIILGGLDKGMDFSELNQIATMLEKAYITGACRETISHALNKSLPQTIITDFDAAVKTVCNEAQPGDIVLLSPACASMDCFDNYRQRGKHFKNIVTKFTSL
jgi:UDP-N-acetylmuramoylalanine--D-glutamate ligase